MEKDTNTTERQNFELVPFFFDDHPMRIIDREGDPWFVARDVCDILELQNVSDALKNLDEDERMTLAVREGNHGHRGGPRHLNIVNETGLFSLIFRSRKPEAIQFKKWVAKEVLPQIRKTGHYATPELEGRACAAEIYGLFSACHNMTIQRINKAIYYLSLAPPLMNSDIAKLMGVSVSLITFWRKRLTSEMAQKAVAALNINAQGFAVCQARPGFPLELPAREASDARA